jgi:DNA helicase-2/ATP-dependent DNA helicase PcrA
VRSAAALFSARRYPDVELVATRGPGEPIQDVRVQNEYEEAAFVADEAARLASSGIPWNEMAVLYRINRQSALLEHEFMHRQIPYVLPLRQRLYHRREVRDILAYLSLTLAPDEAALRQIINSPPRNLGPVSLRALTENGLSVRWQRFLEVAEREERGQEMGLKPQAVEGLRELRQTLDDLTARATYTPPAALIDLVLERTGYQAWLMDELDGEARLNSIHALRREAEAYHTTAEFLAVMRDRIEADLERPDDEGVTLLTIHSAKGLQFRAVFVVGMEEGLLPHARSVESGAEAGERRLAHVAISRACDRLYLVSAQSREHNGRRVYPRPSRYLTALPRDAIIRRAPPSEDGL